MHDILRYLFNTLYNDSTEAGILILACLHCKFAVFDQFINATKIIPTYLVISF